MPRLSFVMRHNRYRSQRYDDDDGGDDDDDDYYYYYYDYYYDFLSHTTWHT